MLKIGNLKKSLIIVVILITISMITACGGEKVEVKTGDNQTVNPTVKLGAAISLTGTMARDGEQTLKGYKLWQDWVNDQGGIDIGGTKHKVDFIYFDDKSDAITAGKLIEKLITEEKVDFLLGPVGSGISASASAISERYNKIMIAPLTSSKPLFERGFKYLFSVLSPLDIEIGQQVEFMATLPDPPKTLAIVFPDDMWPETVSAKAKIVADVLGIEVVYFEKFPLGTSDLAPIITEIKNRKPDALLHVGYFENEILMLKQAKDLKLDVKYYGVAASVVNKKFFETIGADGNYIYGSANWDARSNWTGDKIGSTKDYAKLFEQKYGIPPSYLDAAPATAGIILQTALENAGTTETEKVRKALLELDIDTFFGRIRYDETGSNIYSSSVVLQAQNGKLEVLWPKEAAEGKAIYPFPGWSKQ